MKTMGNHFEGFWSLRGNTGVESLVFTGYSKTKTSKVQILDS